ncbi:hypothetical protein SAMN05660860_01572 [Geoalkalibacter ferrihydriticus]|uniref:Tetratricopeptide repeat protein n=2 Tax=Geoalkalibacter ferrihydriticus TaxID=392333 RepID=A0A0C2HNF1_9BACT|nr:hypothetical protein [Geoalkalibacter ferrihydriticus]KIH76475.1 hypothetical protein GFER_09790 [Geoalkalibacter ferrihydriticus DSM 17813]SDL97179.1 hypothetical protein SAMN05660860_01572 [Geoalkalibacter ferrihydriticus]
MKKLILFSIAITLFVTGCGGGSGSDGPLEGEDNSNTRTISGIVTDPAIRDARLELRKTSDGSLAAICGAAGTQLCNNTWSGADGRFTLAVRKTSDLSDYYLVTHGGIDTVYGTSFESISLRSPLQAFSGHSGEIVVSPVTSILNPFVEECDLRTALGLSGHTNLLADPTENTELLKVSYLLVKIALAYNELGGSEDAFARMGEELALQPLFDQGGNLRRPFLEEVFHDSSLAEDYSAKMDAIAATALRLRGFSGDPAAVMGMIAGSEKLAAFTAALNAIIVDLPETVSDTYTENVTALYTKVEELAGEIPIEGFSISQLARFVAYSNAFFADYTNYLNREIFAAELAVIVPPGQEGEAFLEALRYLAQERVQVASVPLAAPLGNDNAQRAEYYFNSNLDRGYQARTLISAIYNDAMNDEIYLEIVKYYAAQGRHQRAAALADAYIVSSLNRATAYSHIGRHSAAYSAELAFDYLSQAESRFREIAQNRGLSDELVDELILVANRYTQLGNFSQARALREWLLGEVTRLDNSGTPTRFTLHARLISGQQHLIEDLISENQKAEALAGIAYFVELVDKLEINPSPTNANPYAQHMVYYARAMGFYRDLADSANDAWIKNEVMNLFAEIQALKEWTQDNRGGFQWMGSTYYGTIAGHVCWAGGLDAAISEVLNQIDVDKGAVAITGRYAALRGIMIALAEEDFSAARAFYEEQNPLAADFSNLSVNHSYIDAYAYFNQSNPGLAVHALERGDSLLAEKALDYIRGKIDEAVVYYVTHNINEAASLVSFATTMAGSRYLERGYVKLAHAYARLGAKDKAAAVLLSAEEYVDTLPASFIKSKSYATIGYFFHDMGYQPDAAALFDKARTVDSSGITDAKERSEYSLGIARDFFFRGDNAGMSGYLEEATRHALEIHASGTIDNTRARDESTALRNIALEYGKVPDLKKAKDLLQLAIEAAEQITADNSRTTAYANIVRTYARLGLVDLAYAAAQRLHATVPERNSSIRDIAKHVTSIDDFPDSPLAFVDTDKDGRPDFFVPWASPEQIAASGLELDDDSDGDGKPDTVDLTPFHAD